jgi:hypothetical protein
VKKEGSSLFERDVGGEEEAKTWKRERTALGSMTTPRAASAGQCRNDDDEEQRWEGNSGNAVHNIDRQERGRR